MYRVPAMSPSQEPRAAMTLVEMAVTVTIIGFGLFLLVGWTNAQRLAARKDLAVRLLTDLDKCLARYHRTAGSYPQSSGPHSATWATTALLDHDKTRPILEALPPSLWLGPGKKNLVDPWGMPLRYHYDPALSPFVRANGGRPVFESAGPDRDFGDDDPARLGDNLRSDDPGPEGFRLYDLMRDTPPEESGTNGKEDN